MGCNERCSERLGAMSSVPALPSGSCTPCTKDTSFWGVASLVTLLAPEEVSHERLRLPICGSWAGRLVLPSWSSPLPLLIIIWLVALKIRRLAKVALGVAGEIKSATNSIWALGAANQLTEGNLQALRSIEARADAIARALDNQGRRPSP